jgi:hypothetical protein
MCKAADAGYKVFFLLTGTIESLRKQTQERVEEGFIGIDMSANTTGGKRVGVGLDNKPIHAMAMTSRASDFKGDNDKIAVSLAGNNDAVVFVIKKNTTTLTKLTNWLVSLNADPVTKKIDMPMLMIDDEADNASINTSSNKEDPTKINKLIRELAKYEIVLRRHLIHRTAKRSARVISTVGHDRLHKLYGVVFPRLLVQFVRVRRRNCKLGQGRNRTVRGNANQIGSRTIQRIYHFHIRLPLVVRPKLTGQLIRIISPHTRPSKRFHVIGYHILHKRVEIGVGSGQTVVVRTLFAVRTYTSFVFQIGNEKI